MVCGRMSWWQIRRMRCWPCNRRLALFLSSSLVLADVVEQGIVSSLARPGGNLTGFTTPRFLFVGKALQTFKEVAPTVTWVAALFHPNNPVASRFVRSAEAAAKSLAIKMIATPVRDGDELERSVADLAKEPNGGLYLPPDNFTVRNRGLIVQLASRYRLPAVYGLRVFVNDGGLSVL